MPPAAPVISATFPSSENSVPGARCSNATCLSFLAEATLTWSSVPQSTVLAPTSPRVRPRSLPFTYTMGRRVALQVPGIDGVLDHVSAVAPDVFVS